MTLPTGIIAVAPSIVGAGEPFTIKAKVLGPVRPIPCHGNFCDKKPRLHGPFNLNVQRQIQYMDNCLPEWQGRLVVGGSEALTGPGLIEFDGVNQGSFPGDRRPIVEAGGFALTTPGFHFLTLAEPASGLVVALHPIRVVAGKPTRRLVWGDPHWQTFFSDGIRCPEELYHFARYEGFLDFGAISDHMEALTPRQWDYFQAVTNDCNAPGRFATLIGQEWTHHASKRGAPGHRNVYVRGDSAPLLASDNPDCDTLEKLWARLDGMEALAIPHHSANTVMGVKWELGWNPAYEKAVEMHSVWGSSERPERAGNPLPIRALDGEQDGRHVIDALRRGYRLGFVGGGDIHDGRPGDALHNESYLNRTFPASPQGYTAAWVPELSREAVYDAIASGQTYATSQRRMYLELTAVPDGARRAEIRVCAAAEDGFREITLVQRECETTLVGTADSATAKVREETRAVDWSGDGDFAYLRVVTGTGALGWASPIWADTVGR